MFKNNKLIVLLFIVACMVLSASIVSAHENITEDLEEENSGVLMENQNKSFTDLNNDINGNISKTEIILTDDYSYQDNDTAGGINITRSLTIDGQGHTINGKQKSGIFRIQATNVTLKNIKFINTYDLNSASAIFFAAKSTASIINSTFINNYGWDGGAIFLDDNATGTITDCIFYNNSAGYGGAIFQVTNSTTKIKNCIFNNNNARISPVYGYGGAIMYSLDSKGIIENSNFTNNSATLCAGAIVFLQGASVIISNSNFNNNSAPQGGALYHMDYANTTISNSIFTNNTAKTKGGSIYYTWSHNTLLNSTFINNVANDGGAIYNYKGSKNIIDNSSFINNSAKNGGAIFYRDNTKGIINNSVFIGNNAEMGGGIYYLNESSKGIVNNSIFIRNYAINKSTIHGGKVYNCTVIKITPNIIFNKLIYIYSEDDYLKITFKGFNNSAIRNTIVNIEINGISNNTLTTNDNGEIIISTKKLLPNSYKIMAFFKEDDNYQNTTLTQSIYVKKIPVNILAKKKTFKAKKKIKKYSISLKDNKNKAISNAKVTLNVKGKKYISKTNKNGKVIFKLKKLNKKGKYLTTIKYNGDSFFNNSIKKIKLRIK